MAEVDWSVRSEECVRACVRCGVCVCACARVQASERGREAACRRGFRTHTHTHPHHRMRDRSCIALAPSGAAARMAHSRIALACADDGRSDASPDRLGILPGHVLRLALLLRARIVARHVRWMGEGWGREGSALQVGDLSNRRYAVPCVAAHSTFGFAVSHPPRAKYLWTLCPRPRVCALTSARPMRMQWLLPPCFCCSSR